MSSIKDNTEKIKPLVPLVIVLLLCGIFFYLGRISLQMSRSSEAIEVSYSTDNVIQTANVSLSNNASTSTIVEVAQKSSTSVSSIVNDGNVIGAKTSKKYYFPWCGTVKRIKAENQVFFRTISEAKSAGYVPGGNCKGLW